MVSMDTQAGEVTLKCGGPNNQRASAVESANTTAEMINLCYCIQRIARNRPANISKVDSIFGICGIPFIYSADPKFDCNA